MAQWVKGLAAKHDNVSSIPKTHCQKKRADLHTLSSDLHTEAVV